VEEVASDFHAAGHGAQPARMPLNSQVGQEHATFSLSSWIASPQSGQMS
jgi:hypothetical protein